jgi:lipopolysaccharide transport system permease protein
VNKEMTGSEVEPELMVIIEPKTAFFHIDWRELLAHRDLLFLLVRRDLIAKYQQTILGPLWHVIQPLMMAFVFAAVFSRVVAIQTEGVPRILFYLAGLLGWNYFTQTLSTTSLTYITNAALFGKVYFPRLVIPFANALSNLISMGIQFGVFLLFFLGYKIFGAAEHAEMGWRILLLPLVIAQTACLSLGVGLCLSALTVRYRDLQHAIPFLLTIWMFATPVIYPISQTSVLSRWILTFNPMAVVIESYRRILLGIGSVDPGALALSACVTIFIFGAGLYLFQMSERTAIDTV